jgi:T-complex protein 1 subunit delta
MPAYCVRAFAEALEVVPYTLAENAGLSPIAVRSTHQSFSNCKQARPCQHHTLCSTAHLPACAFNRGSKAENERRNCVQIVTELRNKHARGESHAGINVRRGSVTNMLEERVVQPLLVSTSALTLATECVRMILKIGDNLKLACE